MAERPCNNVLAKQTQLRLNKGYDVIIISHDVTTKIFPRYSNYIVDVMIWPKFGNSSIFMTAVIITSILQGFHHKIFFEGCSWFKFNNLELALSLALKFYKSVVKRLKLKVKKYWGLIPVGVTAEKLVRGRIYLKLS